MLHSSEDTLRACASGASCRYHLEIVLDECNCMFSLKMSLWHLLKCYCKFSMLPSQNMLCSEEGHSEPL